ncbi:MAG TPA: amidohydrolase family protein [Alphaproteobacteria bacterium]|nr:amidohydrolase family protein [Alphaproteobacteria bacterium]
MGKPREIGRRGLLRGAVAAGAVGLVGPAGIGPAGALAQTGATRPLPARGHFVIRNAYVMTMDAGLGDVADGDVHVRDGAVVAVGQKLAAPGATVLDGRGMIVLPGFVETHWHMWNTLLRSMAGDNPDHGYFRTTALIGRAYQAEDMYHGTLLAAAEALNNGMTHVHSWCHNIRGPDYARADLRALQEAGLRARFSYGAPQGLAGKDLPDLADMERLHGEWDRHSNGGLITLGFAWRGQGGNSAPVPEEVWKKEYETGRKLGIPISVHASGSRPTVGQIAALAKAGCLSKDMQAIHANFATAEEIQALAASGASVSSSPFTELRIGFGLQQTGKFLAARVPVGLSVDTVELSGNADMFAIMKAIQNVENGETEKEFTLPARRVLELATIEGARSMGIDDRTGSLKPGKRADLIMVSTRDVNIGVFSDPAHMLVEAAEPSNVDTVVVDGRILKRHGRLTALDVRRVVSGAAAARAALLKRANWS